MIEMAGSWSPLLAVLLPLVGAPVVYYLFHTRSRYRGSVAVGLSILPLVVLGLAGPMILAGQEIVLPAPGIPDLDPHFRMDGLSYIFALLAAFIWPVITAYSLSQGYPRGGQARFFTASMVTFSATVGLFVAGDFLTFFLLFEMMTFTAYALLIHRRDRLTMRLSGIYLYMGVAGGLALFFAFMLLVRATGTAAITPAVSQLADAGISPVLVALFLLIGFGAKAGMVGLHIWLPSTYTRAPFPVTAMFSAVMSKAGIYGLLRFVSLILLWPEPQGTPGLTVAWMILWPGLLTMIIGAAMALKAHSVKRLLAFSSMSQMGYMLVGIGSLMALGSHGTLAASGTVMHSLNHALFKTILFLAAGTLALRARGYSWNHLVGSLGGWILIPVAVASLGVAGIPGISGFISKTLIHEGLEEAYYMYKMGHLHLAEYAFSVGSGLTGAYYIKLLLALVFPRRAQWLEHEAENALITGIPDHFDPSPGPADEEPALPSWVSPALLLSLAGAAVLFGLLPSLAVRLGGVLPVLPYGFPAYDVSHLPEVSFFGSHALKASLKSIILGVTFYFVYAFGLSRIAVPRWFSLEALVMGVAVGASSRLYGEEAYSEELQEASDMNFTRSQAEGGLFYGVTGPGVAQKLTKFFDRGQDQAADESPRGVAGRVSGFFDREEQPSARISRERSPQVAERLSGLLEPRERREESDRDGEAPSRPPDQERTQPEERRDPESITVSGRTRPRANWRRPSGSRSPGFNWEVLSYRLDVYILRLKALKEKWQAMLERLPLPDTSSINTRNLNFAALMLAFLSTLTLIYLVSRTR